MFSGASKMGQEKRGLRPYCEIGALVVVWWAGNALFAIDAQNLLKHAPDAWAAADVALTQLVFGGMLAHLYVSVVEDEDDGAAEEELLGGAKSKAIIGLALVAAGCTNFMGATLTNASYRTLGSTSTLVWKLAEPFAVVALKLLVLGERTGVATIIGVAHVVLGVLIFAQAGQAPSTKAALMLNAPIVLANVMYPARNVLVKLDQKAHRSPTSSARTYRSLMLLSAPYALVAFVAGMIIRDRGAGWTSGIDILRNAVLFNAYQVASMALLRRLDALTHAVGNTLKRFAAILLSVAIGGETLGAQRTMALMLALVGFMLYSASGGALAHSPTLALRLKLVAGAASTTIAVYWVVMVRLSTPFL